MLDVEADARTIFVDKREPLLHATEELHVLAEALKGFAGERDVVLLGFFEHQKHIGQDAVGILTLCQFSVSIPEFLLGLSGCLDESELLHVAWRQCSVEIIYQCHLWSFLCHIPFPFFFYSFYFLQ